jgi:putative membrane protein
MYVLYHMTNPSTPFGGQGWIRPVYFFLLLTHIMLSVAVVPLVLVSLSRALSARFDRHRKLARFALPLWLYVAVSGVLVYLMIAPYYPS